MDLTHLLDPHQIVMDFSQLVSYCLNKVRGKLVLYFLEWVTKGYEL